MAGFMWPRRSSVDFRFDTCQKEEGRHSGISNIIDKITGGFWTKKKQKQKKVDTTHPFGATLSLVFGWDRGFSKQTLQQFNFGQEELYLPADKKTLWVLRRQHQRKRDMGAFEITRPHIAYLSKSLTTPPKKCVSWCISSLPDVTLW